MLGAGAVTGDIGSTVASAAAGDVAALARIVERHHRDMARICAVICGESLLADDAVQAAWLTVWPRLGSLRDPERLRPWLMSIAANEARQLMRRERRRRVVEIRVPEQGAGREPGPDLADLSRTLAHLSADDRSLLALRFVAELSSDEIGAAIGLSASGVRSRLERLLARLRTELDHD